jgi:exodeoxyribonuclease V beta subunit
MSTPFDLRAALPRGRWVIEASAGTGKTYTVAGLVARALIETDLPPEKVLVTTFTRAAASELRQRIRARLVEGMRLLDAEAPPGDPDPVQAALWADDATERRRRLDKARSVVADFESLTIGTIHSFCQRILRIAGQDVTLDEDSAGLDGLLDEVINDRIVRLAAEDIAGIDAERLRDLASVALGNPRSQLLAPVPGDVDPDPQFAPVDVLALVRDVISDVRARQQRRLSFDALLLRAHELVTTAQHDSLRALLRDRFTFAVVDEAQDTDPLQWELLQALFPASDGARTLIVVGDPKQSIYAFRGADVDGYVSTRGADATERTLGTNFRSDQPLLAQLNALFGAYAFSGAVHYHPVQAATDRQHSEVPEPRPIVELIIPSERKLRELAAAAARRVAEALAAMRWAPQEIAVLVGTRIEGAAIAEELARYGVAAVTSGTSSVAASEAANELRTLFRVLDDPGDARTMRLAALGWFGDCRAADLLSEDSDRLLPFQERLPAWRRLLSSVGVAGLVEQLLLDQGIIDRIAASGRLARHLTDLAHLTELLHEASGGEATQASALRGTLAQLAAMDEKSELVTRRIESDAAAVQILTIHAAKGLQWPMVVVAKLWGNSDWHVSNRVPHARLQPDDPQRSIDLGYYAKDVREASKEAFRQALRAEDDRLFYVAVTRAEHELVVVAPLDAKGTAPMRCFNMASATSVDAVRSALADRMAGFGARFVVSSGETVLAGPAPVVRPAEPPAPGSLHLAPPPAPVLAPFRHWSFTVATKRRARVAMADELGGEDELGAEEAPLPARSASALAPLPAGAEFGTILHSIFEHIDFAAADPVAAAVPLVQRFATMPSLREHQTALAQGIADVLRTPLGAAQPLDLRLADLPRALRLDELRFDLSLPDRRPVPLQQLGALLVDRLPSDDALRGYAERLAAGTLPAELRGMLNGAIDLVLRHPQRPEQLLIVDYKSNRLPAYDTGALLDAMIDHHYPLQGLLYSVALHRWLRWRTGEADPSPRLGGFAYLFVRGMTGPDTPIDALRRRAGVFHWQAPPGLVAAMSDLLARESDA